MPISRWLKWVAWARFQGPLGGLGDDLRAADLAMRVAVTYTKPEGRHIAHFLPPGREPDDYLPWGIDLQPPPPPDPVEED